MRDDDVRSLLGAAVDDVPLATRVDLDEAVAGGLGLRHRRRVRRAGLVGVGAVVVAVVGVAGGVAVLDLGTATPQVPVASAPPSPATPSFSEMTAVPAGDVDVRCTPDGVELSSPTVSAKSDGVWLRVSSTMAPGAYLTYSSTGGGVTGGDRVPRVPHAWDLQLAPGTVTLWCGELVPGPEEGESVTLEVTDPHGFWAGESLADVGCPDAGSQGDWIAGLGGDGASPEEAVQGVLDALAEHDELAGRESVYDAVHVEIGYLDDPRQTWLVTRDGEPDVTVVVTDTLEGYAAYPDADCNRGVGSG